MNTPTVDVIIPTFNGLPYLKEAVASVLAQTYTDFDLHIIDDGSTDATKAYITGLKDSRIHYHHIPNGGPSAARNAGIAASRALLVAFLDSDDVWLPTKLEQQVALLKTKPSVGLVYGHQQTIDETGAVIGTLRAKLRGHVFSPLLNGNQIIGSASMVLIRRSVLEAVGGFPEGFAMGEDWELWLRIAHDYEVDYCDAPLAQIRVLSSSSQQQFSRNAEQLLELKRHIASEFELTPGQRRRLSSRLDIQTAKTLYWGGNGVEARRVLLRALSTQPSVIFSFDRNSWSVSAKILISSTGLRRAKRRLGGTRKGPK